MKQTVYSVGVMRIKTKGIVTVRQTFSHVRDPLHQQPETHKIIKLITLKNQKCDFF